jgi:hypothetical protein
MRNLFWLVGMSLVLMTATMVEAQGSNLYKLRNGNSVTPMGSELIVSTNTMCTEFAKLQGHFNAMTQQRDSTTNYQTVADQWGVLDPSTNAISETYGDSMYAELNSMLAAASPSVLQWCARIRQ